MGLQLPDPQRTTVSHPRTAMADARARAAEFKAKGNAAFVAKQFDEAINWFTQVRRRRVECGSFHRQSP